MGKSLRFTIPYSKANNKSKSVWWSIHPAPKSFPCIRFSESRILTLGHPHKHCRISRVDELSSDKSMDSASQTNIYRSFTTLRFCITPIRSSIDKIVTSSRFFFLQQECACFLAGPGACGLWPISSLANFELIIGAIGHYSNIQLPSILKSIQLYYLLSFYLYQIKTWLLSSSWGYNCSILPALYLLYIQ